MLKLEMRLDEQQIISDKKYELNNIYGTIDNAFEKYNFLKGIKPDGTIVFCGGENKKDYGAFGMLITTLKDKAWFMDYVEKWLWYNSDDSEEENDFVVEDILYHYTHKESAA